MLATAVTSADVPLRHDYVIERMKESIWSGGMKVSDHCRVRMAERNAHLFDLLKTVQTGEVVESRWDSTYRNHRYRVKGTDTKGDERTVIAAMGNARTVHFVTVFA